MITKDRCLDDWTDSPNLHDKTQVVVSEENTRSGPEA